MTNPTAPSERLLYPNLSTVNEQYINEKIQANNNFNNNINIIKDIKIYYETETNNYNKKLSKYKNYINIAEITEIVLSSIASTGPIRHARLAYGERVKFYWWLDPLFFPLLRLNVLQREWACH